MAFRGMEWHCETCRDRFLEEWEHRAKEMDSAAYGDCRSVHEWMFQRMVIMCRNPPRHFGCIGWAWDSAIHSGEWIGGYAWSDGRSCESQNAPLAVNELGCSWWPCIVAIVEDNDKMPFYCPALAWMRSRPWTIHCSRIFIERSGGRGLCPIRAISSTSRGHAIEDMRSADRPEEEPDMGDNDEEAPRPGSTPEPEAEPDMEPPRLEHVWVTGDLGQTQRRSRHQRERTRDMRHGAHTPYWTCSRCGVGRNWAARARCRLCQADRSPVAGAAPAA